METTERQSDNIIYKKYNIKNADGNYNLKLEIYEEYINLFLKRINNTLDYFYKNKVKKTELLEQFKFNQDYKFNNYLFLSLLDNIYKEKKILIKRIDNNNINIQFESVGENKFEITLTKENMTIDDKLNLIYNEIKSKKDKDANNNYKIVNNINFSYLNNNKINDSDYKKI